MKILVFGNKFLECDSMALKIAEILKNESVEFQICEDISQILETNEEEMTLMDVVYSIEEPMIIEDIKKLKVNQSLSLHDFDLAYFLKLLEEIGQIKKIRIIGIPQKGNPEEIAEKVRKLLPNNF